jgi:hypothetical protein
MHSNSFTFYQSNESNEEKFKKACDRIESDENYQPDITDAQLKKYKNAEKFFIFQPSHINANPYGKIYQLKMVNQNTINDKVVILVSIEGEYSFHKKKHAEQRNFNFPLKFKILGFLNPLTYWRELLLADPDDPFDQREYNSLILQLKNISFTSSISNNQLNTAYSAKNSSSEKDPSHEADGANSESEQSLISSKRM